MAVTTADNEIMQQDFIFEDQKNNQVRNARSIILIVPCVPLITKVSNSAHILVCVVNP